MRKGGPESYPPIILLSDYMPVEDIFALHAHSNCFVSMEKGAAWNIPAFDAIGMGNMAITSAWGGQTDFIDEGKNGFLIPYRMESVHGAIRCPYPTLYSCKEQWSDPDPMEFKRAMRIAYNNKLQVSEEERQKFLSKYSLENIGSQLKDIL
jgi:glycosyltransferase involved in cell wall biosynthesis